MLVVVRFLFRKKKKWEKKLLPIDPRITDTIGELFFLSPQDGTREVRLLL